MPHKTLRDIIWESGKEPNLLEDIESGKIWLPPKLKNIIKFQEVVSILPLQLYKTVYAVLEKGMVNEEYVSKKLDISPKETKEILDFLTTYRYLRKGLNKKNNENYWALGDIYWIEEKFPSGPVIPTIYQFNLIFDRQRTEFFAEAINQVVKKDSVVLDLGAGSGILSLLAAKRGGIVYAYEIDEDNYNLAKKLIKLNNLESRIKIFKDDIFVTDLPSNADVIICEMFDTALLAELQIQAMNRSIKFLNKGGKIIPEKAETTIELITDNNSLFGMDFPLIHYQAYGNPGPLKVISDEYKIHEVSFYNKENDDELKGEFKLLAKEDGIVNAIRFKTNVYFNGKRLTYSEWFNPPIIYPVSPISIKKGNIIIVRLLLLFGGGWKSAVVEVKKA